MRSSCMREPPSKGLRLATLHLRYRSKATGEIVESELGLKVEDLARSWESSSTALRLSSLAAEFAEILKGSYWARDSHLEEVSSKTPAARRRVGHR